MELGGSRGGTGVTGGAGAGGIVTEDNGGASGGGGSGATFPNSHYVGLGGAGGAIYHPGQPGTDGENGWRGNNGGVGRAGLGGVNASTTGGVGAFTAGNGGGGGQGSGGSGGGGGGIPVPSIWGCSGGDGGQGGFGETGGVGGAGGGAVELLAYGRMTANVAVNAVSNGQEGQENELFCNRMGMNGSPGVPGQPGKTQALAMSGGDGGNGGNGGTSVLGGGGAGGTVRLAGTIITTAENIYGQMGGGDGNNPTDSQFNGGAGRLILAQDCNSSVNISMQAGDLVTGTVGELGLHRRSPQLNATAPRLLGLAEGYDTTGILAAKASDLGLEGTSSCPVIACRDVTHLGDDYIGYNMVMLAGGTRNVDYVRFSADPDSAGNLYTGRVGERERVIEFQSGDVYGFLIPEDGVEMRLRYAISRTVLKCTVSLKDEETIDLKADSFVYDSVLVRGTFDLFNAPAITNELTIEETNAGTVLRVDIHDADGGCDFLDVLDEAVLDGTLQVDFGDVTPVVGTEYCFLEADSFSGQFDELEILGIDPGMVDYDMVGGTFTITSIPEPAMMTLLAVTALLLLPYFCGKKTRKTSRE